MVKAAADFMLNSREAREMHEGGAVGSFAFAFPVTEETKEAFGIECDRTGLMVAVRPDADTLEKFADGTLTGFSIGGAYLVNEEASDDAV